MCRARWPHGGAIRELGHGVGNHSFNHRPLAALAWAGKDVVSEIADTDRLIAGAIGDGPFLLRPPYGNWSSGVAEALNDSETTRKYVGPVMWNIDGADFALGTRRGDEIWTLERCAAGYFHLIDAHGGGVVLLHDGGKKADPPSTGGGTFELVERLVKGLRARFEFKRSTKCCGRLKPLAFHPGRLQGMTSVSFLNCDPVSTSAERRGRRCLQSTVA